MSDLISRRMMLDKMISRKSLFNTNQYEYMALSEVDKARADEIDNCIADLRNATDAVPERTAKVVSDDVIITVNGYGYHYEEYLCNACKKKVFSCDSYCSHCGAKLDWSWNE